MEIEGIEISSADRVIFPEKGITKGDMLRYYSKIAEYMLPWLKNRPLSLQRFPSGIDEQGFYQKNAGDYFPDFIETIVIETKDGTNEQVICNNKKTLIYLVNQGVVTFHVWLSTKDHLYQPNRVVYDLDPSEGSFEKVKDAARKLRDFLQKKGHETEVMTTGKSGLHLYYSKSSSQHFDEVREEAKQHADALADKYPDLLTTEMLKKNRKGRIFVDYLRNAYAQTTVCPYSLRPNEAAGVATPIEWRELGKLKSASHYNYSNIFRRLGGK